MKYLKNLLFCFIAVPVIGSMVILFLLLGADGLLLEFASFYTLFLYILLKKGTK